MVSWLLGLDDGIDYPCPVMWMLKVLRNKKLKTKAAISLLTFYSQCSINVKYPTEEIYQD